MKVLIQWAKADPADWEEYDFHSNKDVEELVRAIRKPVPKGGEKIDQEPGWITSINIQGVVFLAMDHISIDVISGMLIVRAWNDDLEDGLPWGQEWTFKDPAPDPEIGNRMNTRQTCVWYASKGSGPDRVVTDYWSWDHFQKGHPDRTLHGIWLSDEHYEAHRLVQAHRPWIEWI